MISYVFSILAWLLYAFVVVLALTSASILGLTLYRLFFHPLAKVPGPRSAAVSNIWYARQVVRGNLYSLGKCLHRQYGPVVRVGPNEVWFSSKEAFKSIYCELSFPWCMVLVSMFTSISSCRKRL